VERQLPEQKRECRRTVADISTINTLASNAVADTSRSRDCVKLPLAAGLLIAGRILDTAQ